MGSFQVRNALPYFYTLLAVHPDLQVLETTSNQLAGRFTISNFNNRNDFCRQADHTHPAEILQN